MLAARVECERGLQAPCSASFAALTMASTARFVMSPPITFSRSCVGQDDRSRRGRQSRDLPRPLSAILSDLSRGPLTPTRHRLIAFRPKIG